MSKAGAGAAASVLLDGGFIEEVFVSGLAAASSVLVATSAHPPPGPGGHSIQAVADSTSMVSETNESDNDRIEPFSV